MINSAIEVAKAAPTIPYCGIKINTITSDRIEVNLAEQGFKEDNIWISNE